MIPFGMSETEWNKFCDSQKCRHGSYCNAIIGLCPKCIMEKGTDEEKKNLKARSRLCLSCGRIIGIYGDGYTHNYSSAKGDICNICWDK